MTSSSWFLGILEKGRRFLKSPLCRQLLTFGIVGFASSAGYALTQSALIEVMAWHPVMAALIAFCVGVVVSYTGNSLLTFKAPMSGRTLQRFVLVTGIGMMLNLALVAAVEALGWHYAIGILIVLCIVPIFNFLGHRFWTFSS